MKETAIYALTHQGAGLGRTLTEKIEGDLFLPSRIADAYRGIPFNHLMEAVAENFSRYPRQIFIAATGIVVRSIAPHLRSKDSDPAVIVLDQKGRYVISLLSGHLGGANAMAAEVAQLIGGEAVITTATETEGVPSIDLLAKERNLFIANLGAVKRINMAVLEGRPVQVFDPEDRLGLKNMDMPGLIENRVEEEVQYDIETPGVLVTWGRKTPSGDKLLLLHPRCLVAGIGCNSGTTKREILELIKATFQENSLALESLKCMSTIVEKRDEKGLIDAARELGVPLIFADPSEIRSIDVPHPSSVVEKHMGVSSVCEATAILKSGKGRLLVPKTKSLNVTLAVALES
jgi:cobalt-precorrin 5A hydrolase